MKCNVNRKENKKDNVASNVWNFMKPILKDYGYNVDDMIYAGCVKCHLLAFDHVNQIWWEFEITPDDYVIGATHRAWKNIDAYNYLKSL